MLPFLIWALLSGSLWLAFGLYVVGAVTDWLDGWIARRFDMVSAFGTFLDPVSDKIYVCSVFLALIAAEHVGVFGLSAMILILAREFMVSGLREYLGPKNLKLPVSKLAKWKTAVQMIATGALILVPFSPLIALVGLLGLGIAALLTWATGWNYLKTALAHMR